MAEQQTQPLEAPPAYCIELESDLLPIDLVWEARLQMLKRKPLRALFRRDSAAILIEQYQIDVTTLPYRTEAIEAAGRERRLGRKAVLLTQLPRQTASAIAGHLNLFDDVIVADAGSIGALRNQHQPQRFAPGSKWPAALKAIRPHQWLKNLLVLLPLILAHQIGNRYKVDAGLLAFWAVSLCASGVYVMNDLLDLPADRKHPRKKNRAFAAALLPIPTGLLMAAALFVAAFVLAALLPWRFGALLACYFCATTAYSFWLKRKALVDVLLLASLYTIRIIAGAAAVQVPLTIWLLAFSMFFFLSLAFIKRYSELIVVADAGGEDLKGRGYHVSDLRIIETVGPASGYISVLVFCNYLDTPLVRTLYVNPELLWLIAPLLLYWITRVWFIARRKMMHDDPILFAIRDRVSILTGLLAAIIVIAAWLPLPRWLKL